MFNALTPILLFKNISALVTSVHIAVFERTSNFTKLISPTADLLLPFTITVTTNEIKKVHKDKFPTIKCGDIHIPE